MIPATVLKISAKSGMQPAFLVSSKEIGMPILATVLKISAKSGMQYFQQYFLSRDIQGLLRSVAQSKNDVGATTAMHKNFCIADPG